MKDRPLLNTVFGISISGIIILSIFLVGVNNNLNINLNEIKNGDIYAKSITKDKLADDVFNTIDLELEDGSVVSAQIIKATIKQGELTGSLEFQTENGETYLGKILNEELSGNVVDIFAGAGDNISTIVVTNNGNTTNTNLEIADGSIVTVKLADNAVTSEKLADGSVGTLKLLDGSITSGKLTDGVVLSQHLANSSITSFKIADNAITTSKLLDNIITTEKIADGAVTEPKIANGAVTSIKLADDSVTDLKIVDGAVTNGKIADGSVTAFKLDDDAVITAKILDGNVTEAKLASGSISLSKLSTAMCSNGEILQKSGGVWICTTLAPGGVASVSAGAGVVNSGTATDPILDANVDDVTIEIVGDTLQVKDGAITNSKLATDSVTTDKIDDGTIVDADIASGAAIAWTKVSKVGSSLGDLATRNASDLNISDVGGYFSDSTAEGALQEVGSALDSINSDLGLAFVNGGNAFGSAATLGTTDSNTLAFITNNSPAMTILTDGKVGIGKANPGVALDVNGTGRFVTINQTTGIVLTNGSANVISLGSDAGDNTNGYIAIRAGSTPQFVFSARTTSPSYILQNLSLGQSTSAPAQLNIGPQSNTLLSDGTYPVSIEGLNINLNGDSSGASRYALGIQNIGGAVTGPHHGVFIKAGRETAPSYALRIQDFNSTELFTVRADGTSTGVGIGTSTPGVALMIFKPAGNAILRLEDSGNANNYLTLVENSGLTFSRGGGSTLGLTIQTTSSSWGANGGYIRLSPNGTEVLRATAAGNVGIGGDVTPDALLSVGSTSQFQVDSSGNIASIGGTAHSITSSSGLNIISGATALNLQSDGSIDVNIAGGSEATGCTFANSTGNLTCTGSIIGGTTGTSGHWTRTGTILTPTNSGDAITVGLVTTTGSGGGLKANSRTGSGSDYQWYNPTGADLRLYNGADTMVINTTGITLLGGAAHSITNVSGALNIDSATTGAINIGTTASAKTITIGNTTGATALVFNSGTGAQTHNSSATTGSAFVFNANSLSSGTGLSIVSTSTALTTGGLGSFYWNPGSATTATGDLFSLDVGTNGTIGNILNVKNNGSSVFSVSQSQITANLPVAFNTPGDINVAYDLLFSNTTSSNIKTSSSFYIQAGEVFNSSDLTLRTFNSGSVVIDSSSLVLSGLLNCSSGIQTSESGVTSCISSDLALKENVATLTSPLSKVLGLRGVSYNWKDKTLYGQQTEYGLIAQEVEAIVPELVFTMGSGIKGVKYQQLTGLLIEAIKEQQLQILALQAQAGNLQNSGSTLLTKDNIIAYFNNNVIPKITVKKIRINEELIAKSVIVIGDTKFYGTAEFNEQVALKNKINVGTDTAGKIKLAAGQTKIGIVFSSEYKEIPVVTISPVGLINTNYGVTNITKSGFEIEVGSEQSNDIEFNWIVVGVENSKPVSYTGN